MINPPGRFTLSVEEIQALKWVEWTRPKEGTIARAVSPNKPTHTLHGLLIPDDATPAQWDTLKCAHSLRKIQEGHFRWRLARAKNVPDGDWPLKQLPVIGATIARRPRNGAFEVWFRGEVVLRVSSTLFHPDRGWWLCETESEFLLWSAERVVARGNRPKR